MEGLRLACAAVADPGLWLGVRDMAGAPRSSRCGRWWTNLWTWVACGVWPQDNQTGLRVYPLPVMSELRINAGRYAFEVESLVQAVWHQVPIRRLAVSVRYPADRISHFHAWLDSLRTAWVFARLVARRSLPWPQVGLGVWRSFFTTGHDGGRLVAAGALGAAMGVAPLPGLQMTLTSCVARKLGLNARFALLATTISFGPLLMVWFVLQMMIGHALRTGDMVDVVSIHRQYLADGAWTTLFSWLVDWLIGSVPVMAACALMVGTLTWFGVIVGQRTCR